MVRERPQARGGMAVHIPTAAVACEACRTRGSLPSTAQAPARHGRPGGGGTKTTTPATWGIVVVSRPSALPVHNDPDVDVHFWIGNEPCCKHGSRQAWHRYLRLGFRVRTPRACSVFETACSDSANRLATSAMLPLCW